MIAYDIQFSEPTEGQEGIAQDNAFMDENRAAGNLVFSTTEVNDKGEAKFLGGAAGPRVRARAARQRKLRHRPGRHHPPDAVSDPGLKSFAVVTAERATGKTVHPFSNDTKLIDFSGPAGTMPSIPFSDVYNGLFPPGFFRNKIVVVGASAPSLQDVHPVSFGQDEMPGPEIQANAIATVLAACR